MITPGESKTDELGDLPQSGPDSCLRRAQSGCLDLLCVVIGVLKGAIARPVTKRYAKQHQLEAMK